MITVSANFVFIAVRAEKRKSLLLFFFSSLPDSRSSQCVYMCMNVFVNWLVKRENEKKIHAQTPGKIIERCVSLKLQVDLVQQIPITHKSKY